MADRYINYTPNATQYYQTQQQYPAYSQSQNYHQYGQSQTVAPTPYQTASKPNSQSSPSGESNVYTVLASMSEALLASGEPRMAIHCLESVLGIKAQDVTIAASFHIQLRTRLNLCRLYLEYTSHTNQLVNTHVEKAMIIIQNLAPSDELKYEATLALYEIFEWQRQLHARLRSDAATASPPQQIEPSQTTCLFQLDLVRKVLETSKSFPIWHVRLLFLAGNILMRDKDYNSASYFMSLGISYCANNPQLAYVHILFILSKGLIHLVQRNTNELQATMQPCAALIENYKTSNAYQVELLKIFFLVLQVTYFVQCGQAKSVRNTLKSLHHYIVSLLGRFEGHGDEVAELNAVTANGPLEAFHWLHKDHLGLVANILQLTHFLQTGAFDKAQELTTSSLVSIDRLRAREATAPSRPLALLLLTPLAAFITNRLNMLFTENQIRCSLVLGQRALAIKQIAYAFKICERDSRLLILHSSQLHCLLGIYALSTGHKEAATSQLNQALKSTDDTDLWLYCAMNLAACYLPGCSTTATDSPSKAQFLSIVENVLPEKMQSQSTALNAFSHYFKALKFFLTNNLPLSQQSLRETVLLANSEDLLNINANALVLTGHVNLIGGQYQESYNMLTNGLSLADQMSDIALKSYASGLLKHLYNHFSDPRESEATKTCAELEQRTVADVRDAEHSPFHSLIAWNGSGLPKLSNPASNSQRNVQTTPAKTQPSNVAEMAMQPQSHHNHHHHHQQPQTMPTQPKPATPSSKSHPPPTQSQSSMHSPHQQQHQPLQQSQSQPQPPKQHHHHSQPQPVHASPQHVHSQPPQQHMHHQPQHHHHHSQQHAVQPSPYPPTHVSPSQVQGAIGSHQYHQASMVGIAAHQAHVNQPHHHQQHHHQPSALPQPSPQYGQPYMSPYGQFQQYPAYGNAGVAYPMGIQPAHAQYTAASMSHHGHQQAQLVSPQQHRLQPHHKPN